MKVSNPNTYINSFIAIGLASAISVAWAANVLAGNELA